MNREYKARITDVQNLRKLKGETTRSWRISLIGRHTSVWVDGEVWRLKRGEDG